MDKCEKRPNTALAPIIYVPHIYIVAKRILVKKIFSRLYIYNYVE